MTDAFRKDELLSHPDKLLATHVAEVGEAARAILRLHSQIPERDQLIEDIVSLHDLGKASAAFQEYIRDTKGYRGRRDRKAHTPLGLAVTLVLGERLRRDPFWKLCVPAAVLGHHTAFPDAHRLTAHHFGNDDWAEIIEKQAAEVPAEEVSQLTGFPLDEILSDPDLCYAADDIATALIEDLQKRAKSDLPAAVADRLKMQFAFSVLLEADKAYLALSSRSREGYRGKRDVPLSPELVEECLRDSEPTEINVLRTAARKEALNTLFTDPNRRLWTLALPTGLGKTLTAASLAMSLRETADLKRRIIIVLPFLSIIDQTAKVYDELLGMPQTSTLMQSHSLSERTYDDTEEKDAEFFLDTWDSEIVVTTFDQFLLSLLGSRTRHQMRFHNLTDAIIVFDEVQALPTQLWDITRHSLTQLTEHLNSTAILMSATQPGFVEEAGSLIPAPKTYYDTFERYRLVLKHREPLKLDDFIESVLDRREELENERVLITLNTRASARAVRNALEEAWKTPVFLTADVTPKDRLAAIEKIKKDPDSPCLVISTQVVEAGVDMDMTLVMRDFAPLDSLVQIAGRCNRNSRWSRKDVEIYDLRNAAGRSFAEMVYTVERGSPDVRLEETRRVLALLAPHGTVFEEDVLAVCDEYFRRLRVGKDLGERHTRNWATLDKDQPNIRTLLRGEQDNQVQLIVAERDETDLEGDIRAALAIEDRWDRRRALRKLAGRIAMVSVSVRVRGKWSPTEVANPLDSYPSEPLEYLWWIVRPDKYDPETGLRLDGIDFL